MPDIRQNARGAVVIDDRYAPLIVATFMGETDLELGRWFVAANKKILLQHAAAGRRLVSICDATLATKPTPEMRRFWADFSNSTTQTMKDATLATFLVVNSPLLRGAITAIGWLSPALRDLESFSTIDDAVREGASRLARASTPIPPLTGPYQMPEVALEARSVLGA
jgi:hypothetical protein